MMCVELLETKESRKNFLKSCLLRDLVCGGQSENAQARGEMPRPE